MAITQINFHSDEFNPRVTSDQWGANAYVLRDLVFGSWAVAPSQIRLGELGSCEAQHVDRADF